jgi:uncharacterized delta-60 repeat protein
MRKRNQLFFGGLILATVVIGLAQAYAGTAGALDKTFGTNGVTVTSVTGSGGIVNAILLEENLDPTVDSQDQGKILLNVGGNQVLRFTTSGLADASFGSNGVAMVSTPIGGTLALQSNGQIVIGGVVTPNTGGAELGAVRLNSNGTLDTSFGSGGVAAVSLGNRSPNVGTAVLVYPTGDILVCTTLISVGRRQPYQTALARFTSSGALDTNFGSQGLSIQTGVNGCSTLALLSSGDILVVNSQAVAQFNSSGGAEATVTGGRVVATSQSSSFFVASIFEASGDYLSGGELFTGRESRGHNAAAQVLRFTQTGTQLDNVTFHYIGPGGSGIQALVRGLAAQSNGNIVAVGGQTTFSQTGTTTVNGLARLHLTSNGALALDPTFGSGGTVTNSLPASSGVVIQPDGNIVTAGFAGNNTDLTLARYLGQ